MENKEFIVPIDGEEFFQARISVYAASDKFHADVTINNIESGKIATMVKQLYNFPNQEELLLEAIQHLSQFLNQKDLQ